MKKFKGFTRAEGTLCIEPLQLVKQRAFTLAEVLITLAVIGVVAAMTIPTLVEKINDKVTENQNKVFQAKLIKALNLTKTAGLLNNTYSSTEDFLRRGLATHYKMSAICGKDNIRDCIPYDTIKYMNGEDEETVNVANLKTAESINIDKEGFEDTAAFITPDGIPTIISYNKNCIVDTEELDKSINSCVAGIYDLNGTRLPNKYSVIKAEDGKTIKSYTGDIYTFNGASVGSEYAIINGVTIVVKAFNPGDSDIYNDPDVGAPRTVRKVCFNNSTCPDYWTAAQKWCAKNNAVLPSAEQLTKIAQILYNDTSLKNDWLTLTKNYKENLNWDTNKSAVFKALGLDANSSSAFLWSDDPYSSDSIVARHMLFSSTYLQYTTIDRFFSSCKAICIKP